MDERTFDINFYNVIIDGNSPVGLDEGSVFKFVMDGDDWTFKNGADGRTSRSRSNIKSGVFTVTLSRTSSSNTVFSNLRKADLTTPSGVTFPFVVKDAIGKTIISTDRACIVKVPDDYDSNPDVTNRAWDFKLMETTERVSGGTEA